MLIVIDPGHGGKDPGALSLDKRVKESFLTLQMALALADKLEYRGHEVSLTRSTDYYPSLSARCRLANDLNADFFISIHVNSADSASATGIETLVYEKPSNTTLRYADLIQKNLIKATKARDRGIKYRGDLTVLKRTKMPAVLVETGFINNPSDLAKLVTSDYQNLIVTAIADAFDSALK